MSSSERASSGAVAPVGAVAIVAAVWSAALLVPGGGLLAGIPLRTPVQAASFAVVVLALALSVPRTELLAAIDRLGLRRARVAIVVGVIVIAAKLVVSFAAPDAGFAACYTNPVVPRPGDACERSFDHPFDGAITRIDREIDFGPRAGTTERSLLTGSDWELSFVNDTRLNVYPDPGALDIRRLPFRATWSGAIDGGRGGFIAIRYVGEGQASIGNRVTRLPASYEGPAVAHVRVGPGAQDLRLSFRFRDTVKVGSDRVLGPYASIRVGEVAPTRSHPVVGTLHVASPGGGWFALGAAVDLLLAAFVLACLAALLGAWSRTRRLAISVAGVGIVGAVLAAGGAGFAPLELPIAPLTLALVILLVVLAWTRPDRLLLVGVPASIAVSVERVLSTVPGVHGVVFRDRGSDWQTYQAFARAILEHGSLEGGESVFYYQPGIRYWAFFQHALLGDGDALPAILGTSLLLIAVFALVRYALGRRVTGATIAGAAWPTRLVVTTAAVALLLAFTAPPILGLVVVGASEVPTWFVIPVLLPLLFTRPTWPRWIAGGALLGMTFVFRPNQGAPALALLAIVIVVHHRAELRRAVTAAGVCLGVMLLPLLHNIVYGGRFVLLPTGANTVEDLPPARLLHVLDDPSVRRILRDKLSALLYLTPRSGRDALLGLAILGVQVAWLVVVVRAWRRRRALPAVAWLLLAWPLTFAVPSLSYDVFVYYPRHIIAMYVAAASAAAFVEARYVAGASPSVARSPSAKVTAGT